MGAGSVWVANAIDGTVSRIDPDYRAVTETIEIAGSPEDVVVGKGRSWVRRPRDHRSRRGKRRRHGEDRCAYRMRRRIRLSRRRVDHRAELPLLRRGAKLAGPLPRNGVVTRLSRESMSELVFGCATTRPRGRSRKRGASWSTQGSTSSSGRPRSPRQSPSTTTPSGGRSHLRQRDGVGTVATLLEPVPNVYQLRAGRCRREWRALGAYAFHELGWRNVVTVGDAEAFNYTPAAGFLAEFCALGGKVSEGIWVPLSTQDYAPYVAQVPRRGVDGFFMVGTGATAAFTRTFPP